MPPVAPTVETALLLLNPGPEIRLELEVKMDVEAKDIGCG